jgi:ABC-type transport system substrate-binding protein
VTKRYPALYVLLALLISLSLLAGCFGDNQPQATAVPDRPAGNQVLRLYGDDPTTLDPAVSQDVSSWQYLLHIYSGLVSLSDDLKVVPDLASSWTVSPDGKTYTFKLNTEAKFQDGKPVTATDVKYSLDRACDPATKSPVAATYLGDIVGATDRMTGKTKEISGIVVKDDKTIDITIDSPKQYFLSKLTYSAAYVVDRKNVESGKDWYKQPNGSGPFKLKQWKKDDSLVLERNDLYYGQKPTLTQVNYYLGGASPMTMYEKGQLDVVEVGLADIDRVTDTSSPLNKELRVTSMLSFTYIGFNTKAKPFDDPKIRQAFAQAIDREKYATVLLKGTRVKAEGILPPGLPGYSKDTKGQPFNIEAAKKLLEASTYKSVDALPEITYSTPGAGLANSYSEIVKKALGINLNVEQVESQFYEDLDAGKFQIFDLSWVADYPDPQNFLDILFHSGSRGNQTNYSNPQVDALLEKARVETNADTRMQSYRQAEQIILQDTPVIPLYHNITYTLVKSKVKGLVITPMGILSLKSVQIGQ